MNFMKYFSLVLMATGILRRGTSWYDAAKKADSPGGTDVTPAEWAELAEIIAASIAESFGMGVDVLLKPKS